MAITDRARSTHMSQPPFAAISRREYDISCCTGAAWAMTVRRNVNSIFQNLLLTNNCKKSAHLGIIVQKYDISWIYAKLDNFKICFSERSDAGGPGETAPVIGNRLVAVR